MSIFFVFNYVYVSKGVVPKVWDTSKYCVLITKKKVNNFFSDLNIISIDYQNYVIAVGFSL